MVIGTPAATRPTFLPNLLITTVNGGAIKWPKATILARVDASVGVTTIGESGLMSIANVGEFQPATQPTEKMMRAPEKIGIRTPALDIN